MTLSDRQSAVVDLLISIEPRDAHDERCPAKQKIPGACSCHLIRNARTRASALDDAGLLRELPNISEVDSALGN